MWFATGASPDMVTFHVPAGVPRHRAGHLVAGLMPPAANRSDDISQSTSQQDPTLEQLEDIAAFCATLDAASTPQLPASLRGNLMVLSAWWAVPLYVRLSQHLASATFDDAVWSRASGVVCGTMAADILPGIAEGEDEQAALAAALASHIKGVCKLWSAAFGPLAAPDRFQDAARVSAELHALFTNDTLGLQESFGLAGNGSEAAPEKLAQFCDMFGAYFHICARALPRD